MKGSQESLTTVVVKDAANWRTPTAEALGTGKHMDSADLKLGARVYNKNGKLMVIDLNRQVEIVSRQHGQAAPANPSTHGSRQGLWPTITAHTPDMESSGPNGHSGTYLTGAVKSWATPRVGGEEKAETRLARGKDIGLHGQVGAMNNTAKLNPRWVETLMGLPVGWVMPSCASPVTIALTSCDSSATESCLQPQSELFAF
jgi:hypothetical protein